MSGNHDRPGSSAARNADEPSLITDPAAAAAVLAAGGLVGLPTETVYGLAADARNPDAVRRVFQAKGRPADHPLIVHLAASDHMAAWAMAVAPELQELADRHWPGPLTLVVPKAPWVPDAITGGQSTVAIRVPAHGLAREVIRLLGQASAGPVPAGVVAPSANMFGQVSPTTAEHVRRGLADRLERQDAILDGGPCTVGVESTIVTWLDGAVRVLRPGAVGLPVSASAGDAAEVAANAGKLAVDAGSVAPRVPGALASHYAPQAQVVVVQEAREVTGALDRTVDGDTPGSTHTPGGNDAPGGAVGLLAPDEVPTPAGWVRLAAPHDSADYARQLYDALRRADDEQVAVVVAVPPRGGGPLAAAIADRLQRASAGR